jgi:hypothetical protein
MGEGFQTRTFPTRAGAPTRLPEMAVKLRTVSAPVQVISWSNTLEGRDGKDESLESTVLDSAAIMWGSVKMACTSNDGRTHFQTPGAFSGGCWE